MRPATLPEPGSAAVNEQPLWRKVRSGLLWSVVQNWGIRLGGLIIFTIMVRVLQPEQLGLFAAATVVLAFLGMLAEQGLMEAVIQREHVTPEQMNAVFWLNMSASLAIVTGLWFAAPWVAQWMKLPDLTEVLRIASLAMPITAASFGQTAMYKRKFEYRRLALISLASTVGSGVVAVVLVYQGAGVWSLVAQSLLGALIITLLLWMKSAWRLTRHADFRAARPLMGYGMHRLGANVIEFANSRYIEVFLAVTLGPVMLAVYSVGVRVYQALMQALSSAVLDVAHNAFSRLGQDRPALITAYYKSVSVTAAVAVPMFCLIAAVAPSFTVALFGERWLQSATVMRYMALLGAIQVMQFYNVTIYNAIGRPGIGLQLMIVKVAFTFCGFAVAHHYEGDLDFLLAAFVISQLALTPINFYLLRRLVGVSLTELARRIAPFCAGCVAMVAAAMAVAAGLERQGLHALPTLVAASAAGGLTYLAFLRVFAPQALRDTIATVRRRS